ncbi:MAG: helix-hairpin-helix domain-containing protein [Armatimonas sp.]
MKSITSLFVVLAVSISACLPALAQDSIFKLKPTPKPAYLRNTNYLKNTYKTPSIRTNYLKAPSYKTTYKAPSTRGDYLKSTSSSKTGKLKPGQGIVSINSAPASELIRVPGIGAKTAENIIRYRTEIGSFGSLEDLMKIKGIGEKTLEKLRPFVTL